MDLWTRVECFVYTYSVFVWYGVLQTRYQANTVCSCASFYFKSSFQSLLYLLSIWTQEQRARFNRHPSRTRYTGVGDGCNISRRSMDHVYPNPLLAVGVVCNSATADSYVSE